MNPWAALTAAVKGRQVPHSTQEQALEPAEEQVVRARRDRAIEIAAGIFRSEGERWVIELGGDERNASIVPPPSEEELRAARSWGTMALLMSAIACGGKRKSTRL